MFDRGLNLIRSLSPRMVMSCDGKNLEMYSTDVFIKLDAELETELVEFFRCCCTRVLSRGDRETS